MSFIDFSAGYQPPGAYVQQVTTQVAQVSPIPTPSVILVGPALGYLTYTDGVIASSSQVNLSQQGIDATSVTVQSASGTIYPSSSGANWALTTVSGATTPAEVTAISFPSTSNVPAGSLVYVSYQYTNTEYFQPHKFDRNYQAIVNNYGQPMDQNNNVVSPLSLAALFAVFNGASQVVICPTTDSSNTATLSGLYNAYQLLGNQNSGSVVVPLPVNIAGSSGASGTAASVASQLASYLSGAEAEGLLMTGFVGFETSVQYQTVAGGNFSPVTVSSAASSRRVANFYPNQLNYFNSLSNQMVVLGGYYLAAAAAGYVVGQAPQTPLTHKSVAGFSGISSSVLTSPIMSTSNKNAMGSGGVAILEPNSQGSLWIRHGVTTATSSLMDQEISLVRAGDAMIETLADTLNFSGIIGSAESHETLGNITSLVTATLENLQAEGVIYGYTGVTADLASVNPTVVAVTFLYSPSYPINYITVSFSVNTSSGLITPSSSGATLNSTGALS